MECDVQYKKNKFGTHSKIASLQVSNCVQEKFPLNKLERLRNYPKAIEE